MRRCLAVNQHFDIAMDLQERRGEVRGHGAVHHSTDAGGLLRPGRHQDNSGCHENRSEAHCERVTGNVGGIVAEVQRIVESGAVEQRDPVSARRQCVARLIETDVSVGAETEHLQTNPSSGGDGRIIAAALGVEIGGHAVEKMDSVAPKIREREQVSFHEITKTAVRVRRDTDELVEIERRGLTEVDLASFMKTPQFGVGQYRRSACRKAEYYTGINSHRFRHAVRERLRDVDGGSEDGDLQ